jgi:hypothetical protein
MLQQSASAHAMVAGGYRRYDESTARELIGGKLTRIMDGRLRRRAAAAVDG